MAKRVILLIFFLNSEVILLSWVYVFIVTMYPGYIYEVRDYLPFDPPPFGPPGPPVVVGLPPGGAPSPGAANMLFSICNAITSAPDVREVSPAD